MPENLLPGPFAAWVRALAEGKKTLPNCDGERHHYVPRFHLKHFRGGGRLFQLDKTDGTCEEVKLKDAAWAPNLYSLENDDAEHNGVIEGFFSVAEGFAAESLSRLVKAPDSFTLDDRGNLAFLFAIQEQRAPGYLTEWEQHLAEIGTAWSVMHLANLAGPKGKKRRGRESAQALTEGKINLGPTKAHSMETVLQGLATTVGTVCALPWTVLRAKQGSFVCSDRPITMRDPAPPHKFSGAAWLSSPAAITTVPLSSTACLRFCPADGQPLDLAERETIGQVDHINLRTYGWATRYVYGSSATVLEALHARALANPGAVPVPTKKRVVLLEDPSTADPAAAARNVAKGWEPYLAKREDDGSYRVLSYEVIDSVEDMRRAIGPRKMTGSRVADDEGAAASSDEHPDAMRPAA